MIEGKINKWYKSFKLMNIKYALFPIFLIIVMGFVSASDNEAFTDQVIKTAKPGTLKFNCEDNGFACSSSTKCNLTILYPNATIMIFNQVAQYRSPGLYTYNLTASQTTISGIYIADPFCINSNGETGSEEFRFVISPSGDYGSLIVYVVICLINFILFGIAIYKNDTNLGLLSTFGFISIGLYTLLNGIHIYRNAFTEGFSIVMLGIGGYLAVTTAMEYLDK